LIEFWVGKNRRGSSESHRHQSHPSHPIKIQHSSRWEQPHPQQNTPLTIDDVGMSMALYWHRHADALLFCLLSASYSPPALSSRHVHSTLFASPPTPLGLGYRHLKVPKLNTCRHSILSPFPVFLSSLFGLLTVTVTTLVSPRTLCLGSHVSYETVIDICRHLSPLSPACLRRRRRASRSRAAAAVRPPAGAQLAPYCRR
jgi:hypothetical protein